MFQHLGLKSKSRLPLISPTNQQYHKFVIMSILAVDKVFLYYIECMAVLSPKNIEQIAKLARLELTQDEKERYAAELSVVFEYIGILQEADTEDVKEACQVTGLEDVTRDDAAVPSGDEDIKNLINAFPDRVGTLLKVPAVFE